MRSRVTGIASGERRRRPRSRAPSRRRRSTPELGSLAAFVVGAAIALLPAAEALAHKRAVRRSLFLETAGERELHVVVAIRVPGGEARRAFDLLADADRDGRYGEREREAVRGMLAARALDGLVIRTGTAALPLAGVEVKERIEGIDGPIEVMLHATAALPASPGVPEGALDLSVNTGSVGDPLDLWVLSGSRPVVEASRGRIEKGSFKAELGLHDRVRFRVQAPLVGPVRGG